MTVTANVSGNGVVHRYAKIGETFERDNTEKTIVARKQLSANASDSNGLVGLSLAAYAVCVR